MDQQETELVTSLNKLNKYLHKLTSLKYSFVRGIVTGIGTAIGFSLLATAVIALLVQIITSLQDIPLINALSQILQISQTNIPEQ